MPKGSCVFQGSLGHCQDHLQILSHVLRGPTSSLSVELLGWDVFCVAGVSQAEGLTEAGQHMALESFMCDQSLSSSARVTTGTAPKKELFLSRNQIQKDESDGPGHLASSGGTALSSQFSCLGPPSEQFATLPAFKTGPE